MHSESGNSGSGLATPIRTTDFSRFLSSSSQLSGLLAASGSKDYRLNADYNPDSDHAKITMKTRVAVRDKTPHRFQVVPLRDARKVIPFEGGRPSPLALPGPMSHSLLRSASIRRQTYSQVRPVITSSYSQSDTDKCDIMMQTDGETFATPCAEMSAMPILALSPSFEFGNPAGSLPLAEQDMNRRHTKATTNKYHCSVTTPTKAPQGYDASYHTYVQSPVALSSEHSSIHTNSQSLNLASCNGETYPKISVGNTPEHLFELIQSSPRKKRTRSENISRIRDKFRRDGPNAFVATVTEDSHSTMAKRHAIYTQSLYVPFLELPNHFPRRSADDRQKHHQFLGVHPNEKISESHPDEASQALDSNSGTTLSNMNSDKVILATGQDLVESAPSPQMLKSPGFSAIAPHSERYRGLQYHRLSRVYPLSAEARLHIVYPRIVREIFIDIDRAIYEWKHI